MQIRLQGGLEQYFNDQNNIEISKQMTEINKLNKLKDLILYLISHFKETENTLFRKSKDGSGYEVSPGNLCFINGVDYELCSKDEATISFGNEIYFISTMHGG